MMLTFKQFLLEFELDVPPTSYGYWIECQPNGRAVILPVSREEGHRSSVRSHNDAYIRGWIRVVVGPGEANFEWMQDRPSRMCYEAMIAIIEKHGIRSEEQYGQFFVQFDSFDGKTVRGASKQTQGVQSATSFVKQLARSSRSITEQFAFLFERILLELSIPNTDYGYWIKDTGSFISVGYEQHENVAKRELEKLSYGKEHGSPYFQAFRQGWTRAIIPYTTTWGPSNICQLEIPKDSTSAALRSVKVLLNYVGSNNNGTQYSSFVIDPEDRWGNSVEYETDDPKRAWGFIQRATAGELP